MVSDWTFIFAFHPHPPVVLGGGGWVFFSYKILVMYRVCSSGRWRTFSVIRRPSWWERETILSRGHHPVSRFTARSRKRNSPVCGGATWRWHVSGAEVDMLMMSQSDANEVNFTCHVSGSPVSFLSAWQSACLVFSFNAIPLRVNGLCWVFFFTSMFFVRWNNFLREPTWRLKHNEHMYFEYDVSAPDISGELKAFINARRRKHYTAAMRSSQ